MKVQPFSSAKVLCMCDHVKPATREVNPDNIILHVGTNDWNSAKISSQIARSITDLAVSLKTSTNTITNSLFTPRNDHLNNNGNEVNDRPVIMRGERQIPVIGHRGTICPDTHLNKSGLHLNKSGAITFAKNIFRYLLEPIVKMQNICNLIGWNSVHISVRYFYLQISIDEMWNARKRDKIWIYTSLKHTCVGIGQLNSSKVRQWFN